MMRNRGLRQIEMGDQVTYTKRPVLRCGHSQDFHSRGVAKRFEQPLIAFRLFFGQPGQGLGRPAAAFGAAPGRSSMRIHENTLTSIDMYVN